jgi:hypothetical protein
MLTLDPQLGQVLDETASVAPGKLLLSTQAWRQLLGHSAEDLIDLGKRRSSLTRPTITDFGQTTRS